MLMGDGRDQAIGRGQLLATTREFVAPETCLPGRVAGRGEEEHGLQEMLSPLTFDRSKPRIELGDDHRAAIGAVAR